MPDQELLMSNFMSFRVHRGIWSHVDEGKDPSAFAQDDKMMSKSQGNR